MRTSLALLLSAGVALTHAGSSSAETVDAATRAAARQLGEEGMKLYDKGDCVEAAEKLSRAHSLVRVPTLAFYAGKCLEKLGRLVEASERYLDATRDTVEAGAAPAQRSAQAEAERARKAIVPRLASVEIALQPPLPDAVAVLDGKPLPAAMLGVKQPIDPGSHTVEAQRAGGRLSRSFTIKEAESMRVVVDVPAGYPAYGPSMSPPGALPYGYPPPYVPAPAPPMQRQNTGLFVGGVILIPVGAIALLAGGLQAASTSHSSAPGIVILSLGLLGLGGGIAMTVIGGKKVPAETKAAPRASLETLIGPSSAGLRVRF